jgi:hypothetical protein
VTVPVDVSIVLQAAGPLLFALDTNTFVYFLRGQVRWGNVPSTSLFRPSASTRRGPRRRYWPDWRRLEADGTPIGPLDTLIAGTALACRGVIVTRNVSEYGRVPGLIVEDWYGDAV